MRLCGNLDDRSVALIVVAHRLERDRISNTALEQENHSGPCPGQLKVIERLEMGDRLIAMVNHLDDQCVALVVRRHRNQVVMTSKSTSQQDTANEGRLIERTL